MSSVALAKVEARRDGVFKFKLVQRLLREPQSKPTSPLIDDAPFLPKAKHGDVAAAKQLGGRAANQ